MIPDVSNLANKASLNGKIYQVKDEIPSITNLATDDSLSAKIKGVTDEISNISYYYCSYCC